MYQHGGQTEHCKESTFPWICPMIIQVRMIMCSCRVFKIISQVQLLVHEVCSHSNLDCIHLPTGVHDWLDQIRPLYLCCYQLLLPLNRRLTFMFPGTNCYWSSADYRWRLAESTMCPLKMWSDRCLLSSCSICILVSPALLGCCLFVSLKTVRLMGWWSWVHLLIRAFLLVLVCLSSLFKLQTCLVCAAPLSAARITLCCMCVAEECGSADLDMAQRF